jgi:endonuclease YncB( thermonuclease family)
MSARIVSITDGDTVDVQDQRGQSYTVRLAGIEASWRNGRYAAWIKPLLSVL